MSYDPVRSCTLPKSTNDPGYKSVKWSGRRAADPDLPFFPPGGPFCDFDAAFHFFEDVSRRVQERPAGIGHLNSARFSPKQANAKLVLKRFDLPAERRLLHA